MSDIMKLLVSVYGTRDGEVRLSDRQEKALQAACVFQPLGYHFSRFGHDTPTYTDAQVADMCKGYKFIARIARGSGELPYVVVHPDRENVSCLSFTDAVKCARDIRCDVLLVSPDIYRPECDVVADAYRSVILIVGAQKPDSE